MMQQFAPPPWALVSWPTILCQASVNFRHKFVHVDTRVSANGILETPASGQTIWCSKVSDGDVGMAWDWVQVMPHVVAMADPMAVVTNLRFVGNDGDVLPSEECALLLNEIVFSLPWQHEVMKTLNSQAA